MERRKNTRVAIQLKAELHLPNRAFIPVATKNLSLTGVMLGAESGWIDEAWIGKLTVLKLIIHSDDGGSGSQEPLLLEFQCEIMRTDQSGIGMRLVGIDAERFKVFEKLLLENADDPTAILRELQEEALLFANPIDVTLLQEELGHYIVDSVKDLFGTMLTIPVTAGQFERPNLAGPYQPPQAEASALVSFNGALNGGIHLFATLKIAKRISADLASTTFHSFDEEARDAYGELANMIAGGVQTGLSEAYEKISLTPPTIIVGKNYEMAYKSGLNCVRQHFLIEDGSFCVECFFS